MSESNPIRNTIIGTVAGGVILALLSLLWPPALAAMRRLLAALMLPVPIPVWALLIFGLLLLALGLRRVAHAMDSDPPQYEDAIIVSTPSPFQELETLVLKELARANGHMLSRAEIMGRLDLSELRAQATMERLHKRRLVEVVYEDFDSPTLILTSAGREYVVEQELD